MREQKVGGRRRGRAVARLVEHCAGPGQGVDHQPVPTHQHLVVAAGPHAAAPGPPAAWRRSAVNSSSSAAASRPSILAQTGDRLGEVQDVAALEIARSRSRRRHCRRRPLVGAQHGLHLLRRPDVELAFLAFAVGVLARCRSRRADRSCRGARSPASRGRRGGSRSARSPARLRDSSGQQGVVVEHFLEMRHEPSASTL